MLDLRGLSIGGADGAMVVRDLSLSLPASGITALIGPSGCGKSSVLKWLAGILPKDLDAEGQLMLDGQASARPSPAISYQPQGDGLFPWLTVAQNAALGLQVRGLSRAEALSRVAPLFRSFGLKGTESQFPDQLSGGMRQRAAFLRTVVQDSRYILLDEPFSALDAVTRLRMQDWLVARLADRPRGVLLVTHDLHEATRLADRILVMTGSPGRIVAEIPVPGPPTQRSEAALAPLRDDLKSLLLENAP
ncbi:ABC transporter ATP-binding protein [Paracoccus aerius]|uniref:ATP-binding cassette domain-containing protein n=1 Tax=Paracoccus aerius TaxID=1915382 RepID=A0ABS1SAT5_9RHOB|nr:ATP-binding cassette domain-containing protein [Paracoccus aerius]MBL3675355.1 ATP-binding cassette domain-containing protein [Paracoccus aerius]GHG32776.1 ABC transporter ATP-binding protein [Paracoccus aerius]